MKEQTFYCQCGFQGVVWFCFPPKATPSDQFDWCWSLSCNNSSLRSTQVPARGWVLLYRTWCLKVEWDTFSLAHILFLICNSDFHFERSSIQKSLQNYKSLFRGDKIASRQFFAEKNRSPLKGRAITRTGDGKIFSDKISSISLFTRFFINK
ncbi:hypothetical protein AVEN_231791-1 [Araneus ventricosus]|uniref:Uncharacterized protein n=1 Tax=Araneus ventricosus TaxID=182803 RepID=A0A4Y2QTN0_ARAVE|nr:hypothetical protein AVEN_231791-1 [Araneus ventricosus]